MSDAHVSQNGTGDLSGSDANNTASMTSLSGLWAGLTAGTDVLYVHGTITTQFQVGKSGTSGNLMEINGSKYNAVYASTDAQTMRTNSNNYVYINGGTFTGGTDYQFYPFGSTDDIYVENATFIPVASITDCIRFICQTAPCKNFSVTNCSFAWADGMLSSASAVRMAYLSNTTSANFVDGFIFSNNESSLQCRIIYSTNSNAYTNGRRTKNLRCENNVFRNTPAVSVNLVATSGDADSYSVIGNNQFYNCGITTTGVLGDLVNVIQTGNNLQLVIEKNTIINPNTSATGGDGHGIIVDHLDTTQFSDGIIVRCNTITGATSKATASGINVYSGTNTQVYGNVCKNNNIGIKIALAGSTGTTVNNNTLRDNINWGGQCDSSAPSSIWKNNVFSGSTTGLGSNSIGTLPTESYNTYYNNTTDLSDLGTPQTIDSTSTAAIIDPLDSSDVPVNKGDAFANGIKWWTGPNPESYSGEPFSDFDTDIGAIQSTYSPFHPVNL